MNQILKKYLICLIFSFDLFILVWLTEMLQPIVHATATGLMSGILFLALYASGVFFLFVFGIIPLILLGMWVFSPIAVKKLFVQFGLTEKLLDKKAKKADNKVPYHDEIRHSILTVLYKNAETAPNNPEISRKQLLDALKIADSLIDFNISYLEQERLLKITRKSNDIWLFVKIISSGVNIIEHKEQNKSRYPFLSASILPMQIEAKVGLINVSLNQ